MRSASRSVRHRTHRIGRDAQRHTAHCAQSKRWIAAKLPPVAGYRHRLIPWKSWQDFPVGEQLLWVAHSFFWWCCSWVGAPNSGMASGDFRAKRLPQKYDVQLPEIELLARRAGGWIYHRVDTSINRIGRYPAISIP